MQLRRLTAAIGIGLVGLLVGTAAAQQSTTTTEKKAFEIISVDGNQLVVRGADGRTKEVTVTDDFQLDVNGQPVSVRDLKPGMKGIATITTTTTVKPVTVTEVKNGTVMQVIGNTIVVRLPDGKLKMFSQGDVEKRNVSIVRDGQPIMISQLHANDNLTATIITEKPPQVVTERQVQASMASGQPPSAAGSGSTAGDASPDASSGKASTGSAATGPAAPAGMSADASNKRHLPKTASSLPLVGLLGGVFLVIGLGMTLSRRRSVA